MTNLPKKEDMMRDLNADDALSALRPRNSIEGMRHSIRPRRKSDADDPFESPQRDAEQPVKTRRIIDDAAKTTSSANPVFKLKRAEPEPEPLPEFEVEPFSLADELEADVASDEPFVTLGTATPYHPPVVAEPDLPRWHELAKIKPGSRLGKGPTLPVVDDERESTSVRAFDLLRTRLRQTTQEHGWTNIAITAPTTGCGNTFVCVNLALSLSRISGSRTVLMDFDLRTPGVAKALDMRPRGSMGDFLGGHSPISDHMVRVSDTLALGLNNRPDVNAAETLQAAETAHTLERMRAALQPEIVIYDMPCMLAHDDVSAFLPHLDAVLLVSDGTQTMSRELMECERQLEGKVPLLGVVLNRARNNSIKRYA